MMAFLGMGQKFKFAHVSEFSVKSNRRHLLKAIGNFDILLNIINILTESCKISKAGNNMQYLFMTVIGKIELFGPVGNDKSILEMKTTERKKIVFLSGQLTTSNYNN